MGSASSRVALYALPALYDGTAPDDAPRRAEHADEVDPALEVGCDTKALCDGQRHVMPAAGEAEVAHPEQLSAQLQL